MDNNIEKDFDSPCTNCLYELDDQDDKPCNSCLHWVEGYLTATKYENIHLHYTSENDVQGYCPQCGGEYSVRCSECGFCESEDE